MSSDQERAPASAPAPTAGPCNVWDYARLAEQKLEPGAFGYFAGGAGDELTLRENVEAYRRLHLRPRVLAGIESTTATTVLGSEVSMPLLVAPVALQRMAHPDGELATARAAQAAGTIMTLSTLATSSPADVAAAAPGGTRWFQLYCYRDPAVTQALMDQATEAGFEAIVLTVDAPPLGRRERDLRTGFTIPADITVPSFAAAAGGPASATVAEMFSLMDPKVDWSDLERLVLQSELPVVVKGVMTGEDGRLACEHGAAAIVVSNHGGRQLDGIPATIDALPQVVEAVEGRVQVLVDGGVRRGTDVVKALALGARAVLVGRPIIWGLAVAGEQGARRVLELLRQEIELALALTGCGSPADVTRAHVQAARSSL
jgi:isopentenyl diphosphate isomerase/L-lactate dehydrogenase-like FMN-dependent dehydrogenase